MKVTKKEIRRIYRTEKSMNRIENKLILSAIDKINEKKTNGYGVRMTIKNIINYAYDLQ